MQIVLRFICTTAHTQYLQLSGSSSHSCLSSTHSKSYTANLYLSSVSTYSFPPFLYRAIQVQMTFTYSLSCDSQILFCVAVLSHLFFLKRFVSPEGKYQLLAFVFNSFSPENCHVCHCDEINLGSFTVTTTLPTNCLSRLGFSFVVHRFAQVYCSVSLP